MILKIDPTCSHVSFAVRVLSVSTTRGRFHALRGHLHIDEQNPANSWVEAEVEAASIDTRNKLRDAHLRSAAFFAVRQYPSITFQSTRVEHVGGQDLRPLPRGVGPDHLRDVGHRVDEEVDLPAPQQKEGNSRLYVAPAYRLPDEVTSPEKAAGFAAADGLGAAAIHPRRSEIGHASDADQAAYRCDDGS